MGLFDKFKKEETKTERISIFESDYPINKSSWYEVFSACLGQAIAIQEACAEQVVQNQDWSADFATGQLIFGNNAYPVQFLGSESNSSNTWKWAFDNVNGFPETLLGLANETKHFGEKWSLEALFTADLELNDRFNGHNLSIVACGVSKDNYCYYSAPHAGGSILMAFSNVPSSVFNPVDVHKFILITMNCLEKFSFDHKIFIESFLSWNNTAYSWHGNTIIADFSQNLHIEFHQEEEFLRITSIEAR